MHLTAYHPVAKWTTGHVATRASANTAAALLDKLIAEAPFAIEGIQVDGGSVPWATPSPTASTPQTASRR